MDKYLVVITTILVATQVIRIVQNTLSLYRQNKLFKAELGQLSDITDSDLKRKMEVDKLLIELLPRILETYEKPKKEQQQ